MLNECANFGISFLDELIHSNFSTNKARSDCDNFVYTLNGLSTEECVESFSHVFDSMLVELSIFRVSKDLIIVIFADFFNIP